MLKFPNNIQDHLVLKELRNHVNAINDLDTVSQDTADAVKNIKVLTLDEIQKAITLGGSNPINVTGLLGVLGQVQTSVNFGTHAQRLATSPINSSLWWETDRTVLYVGLTVSNATSWYFADGTMLALTASRPVDLGTKDAGFRFVDTTTDQNAEYLWTGTEFVTIDYLQEVLDAATVTITTLMVLVHRTTDAGGAGNQFGSRLLFQLNNSINVLKDAGFLDILWDVSATTNEGSRFRFSSMRAGAAPSSALEFNTALTLINGLIEWKSAGANLGTMTHANSATRSYAFPDADGSIPYETAVIVDNNVVLGGGGALIKDSGHAIFGSSAYSISNVTASRSYDADATTVDGLADVLGTLIADLQSKGILS